MIHGGVAASPQAAPPRSTGPDQPRFAPYGRGGDEGPAQNRFEKRTEDYRLVDADCDGDRHRTAIEVRGDDVFSCAKGQMLRSIRLRGTLEAGRFLPAGGASISCANSCRTERRDMRRPSLESNAIGQVFHHMELNATSALRAGDTP